METFTPNNPETSSLKSKIKEILPISCKNTGKEEKFVYINKTLKTITKLERKKGIGRDYLSN